MRQSFIGRETEISLLKKYATSDRAEFVAIYGRRRVGKTFLINNVFKSDLSFSMTGIIGGNQTAQIQAFVEAMDIYAGTAEVPANWFEAFRMLRHYLSQQISKDKPCVVFIDELPCFDTRKSDFTDALGHFWNSWASLQPEMLLIVCGSATSWMMNNVIDSHGGLHNRITHEIHLKEFTLRETEIYLNSRGFHFDRNLVAQTYMILGGIPYYLSLLDNELSLSKNVDNLFFRTDGEMHREFLRLYKTLFSNHEPYVAIVEELNKKKSGLTRGEIAKNLKVDPNGRLTKMLRNLVDCDIVRFFPTKQKTISKRNGIYQLMDFFSMFYMHFMRKEINDTEYWTKNQHTPAINTWRGLTFEKLCLAHIEQIKHALRIDAISAIYYSWRSVEPAVERKAQIDLIIDRADRQANVCEIKYSEMPYSITKDEYAKYTNRIAAFKAQTGYRGGIIPTFITANGLVNNSYSESLAVKGLTLDDLF